jgi:hypothetical protein
MLFNDDVEARNPRTEPEYLTRNSKAQLNALETRHGDSNAAHQLTSSYIKGHGLHCFVVPAGIRSNMDVGVCISAKVTNSIRVIFPPSPYS